MKMTTEKAKAREDANAKVQGTKQPPLKLLA